MNQANPQNTPTKMENTPSYNNKMQEETTQEIERVYSLKGAIEKNHTSVQPTLKFRHRLIGASRKITG
jgi:hypothetical protein